MTLTSRSLLSPSGHGTAASLRPTGDVSASGLRSIAVTLIRMLMCVIRLWRQQILRLSARVHLVTKTVPVLWAWSGIVTGPEPDPTSDDRDDDNAERNDDWSYAGDGAAGVTTEKTTSDIGQTTAEYGLVILAAGTLALAVILWARSSGSITGLFESVINQLTGNVG